MTGSFSKSKSVVWALLAAFLFALSVPLSKQLLLDIPPLMLAAFLYLGAGLGMLLTDAGKACLHIPRSEARLSRHETPTVMFMVLLDVAAPVCLMLGLSLTTAANASLLGNFEIVATSIVALIIYKEAVGKRLWISIAFITLSSILLSLEKDAFCFSPGSVLVLLACLCWGFENNCTRKLSLKDPTQIVIIKGLGSGLCALAIAFLSGELLPAWQFIGLALLMGFVSYGLSIFFYVKAQRALGSSRTSAYYAIAPFIGAGIALLVLKENVTASFAAASVLMALGVGLSLSERHRHPHMHMMLMHEHKHTHDDPHHQHPHDTESVQITHSHSHQHQQIVHEHEHLPDMHHHHGHTKNVETPEDTPSGNDIQRGTHDDH